jgi:hypothetical protein
LLHLRQIIAELSTLKVPDIQRGMIERAIPVSGDRADALVRRAGIRRGLRAAIGSIWCGSSRKCRQLRDLAPSKIAVIV